MPSRAFVPAALIEAQPRVYKSFRGRQLYGLVAGAAGALLVLALTGVRDFTGYALAFVAALPGFAYGYYQPQGRPVEYWLRIHFRYFATRQRFTAVPPRRFRIALRGQIDPVLRACRWYLTRPPRRER